MNPRLRFKQADGTDYPDWEEKKLGEILTQRREMQTISEEAPLLAFTIEDGVIDPKDKKTNKRDFLIKDKESKKFQLTKYDDIIYNPANIKFGAIHRNKFGQGVVSPIYVILTTNQNSGFLENYFKRRSFLQQTKKYLEGTVEKLRTLKSENFLSLSINLPCIEEQEKIADCLSSFDNLISIYNEQLKTLQEQKKGVMQKIFNQKVRFKKEDGTDYPDWEEKKIGDICKTFSGGTPRTGVEEYYNGNINFIRSGEIHDSNTELFISEEGLKNSSAKIVNVGDILLALYGATSGEIDLSKVNGAINQAILCIRPQEGFNKKFIVEIFRYNKNNILKFYLQGGQGNLSAQNILKLNFPFPCLEEQQKIANCLSAFDEAIKIKKEQIKTAKELKKGLLQQMFV